MAVAATPAGRSVEVALRRDNARRTLNVRITAQEPERTALLQ
jgi:hypothetical protein